ncbi:MAG: hypothetical protein DWQ31_03990 [Planctomycetota bacterium]|nr:MAG: hypothetical protein DWQ31_03990 [Planctomycetota bacterium]
MTTRVLTAGEPFSTFRGPLPSTIAQDMNPTTAHESNLSDAAVRGPLPPRLRLLLVCGPRRVGAWQVESLVADRTRGAVLEVATEASACLARLRDEVFDAIFIGHEPDELDAVELTEAIRASGCEDPLLVLHHEDPTTFAAALCDAGVDAALDVAAISTEVLVWHLTRASERVQLIRENRRHAESQRQRLELEHDEANRLLDQQRTILVDLERALVGSSDLLGAAQDDTARQPSGAASNGLNNLPAELVDHYGELVRAYVVMGSGNLATEMRQLAELLVAAGVSSHEAMMMHLDVVQRLVRGRGSRSARHLVSRAELLILEIMVHLVEGYRSRLASRDERL